MHTRKRQIMHESTQEYHPSVRETRKWILDVVIGLDLCPFAAKPFLTDRIRYSELEGEGLQTLLEACIREADLLDQHRTIETTLLILPGQWLEFEDYLDALELCEALLADQGYEGVYQLAGFHPAYQFNGLGDDDPGNYTNRSPHPMIHFIRESSITQAVESYPDIEGIPERNRRKTREMGLHAILALRNACLIDTIRDSG